MSKYDGGEHGLIRLAKWLICRLTWKLIAQLTVLSVLSGLSYFAWEARWNLSAMAVNHWGEPEIKMERLPAVVDGLATELSPDSIFVWSANVGSDTRRPMLVWIDGKRRPELEGGVEPLFPDDPARMGVVVRLIRGEEFCLEHAPWSPVGKVLASNGVSWVCAVGIPPEYASLVGVITIGFREKREGEDTRIKASLRRWSLFATGKDD
ncbi:hypothetical protein D3C84_679020 [compost metagenome]